MQLCVPGECSVRASRLPCALNRVSWVPAGAGRALEPTVVAVHSQRMHAKLNGWRTPGGIILREPVQASVEYTPALARHGTACTIIPSSNSALGTCHICMGSNNAPPTMRHANRCSGRDEDALNYPGLHCVAHACKATFLARAATAGSEGCASHGWVLSMCARYGFAQVSPLLADVAAVDEGGLVRLTATPAHMELPSERLTVRVEPLQ